MTDPIADYLTRLRNAIKAGHQVVEVPASNLKKEITRILFEKGYILSYKFAEDGPQGTIKIALKYDPATKSNAIKSLQRVSTPGLRQYVGYREMPRVLNGLGIAILSLFNRKDLNRSEKLTKEDFPYVIGMIILDIAAPIFLMMGIRYGSSANASLLGNFEIVATTIIALFLFKEPVSKRLWIAIGLITLSSILLSFEGSDSFRFSYGSLFVLLATVCWGMENNCTRNISSKSTYEIVILKGIFSGLGALGIAMLQKETVPAIRYIAAALLLGFIAYGLSIFLYVRAQNVLGAAKTSAYYAVNPFIGSFLSFVFLNEKLSILYLAALLVMIAGSMLVVRDTLVHQHSHMHTHTFTHTHDGSTHTHTVMHSHEHDHYITDDRHNHHHTIAELEKLPGALHH